MIQRFCFVKLREAEAGRRAEIAAQLAQALAAAGARAVVGVPADDSAARWDVSIVIEAESLAAWRAMEVRAEIAAAMQPVVVAAEVVKAWSFEAV